MLRIGAVIVSIIVIILSLSYLTGLINQQVETTPDRTPSATLIPSATPSVSASPASTPIPAVQQGSPASPDGGQGGQILFDVPFAPQAPFGEWEDPRQQDGCEEASALMAVFWATGRQLSSLSQAKEEILAISAYQEREYGEYRDTSAFDTTERIIRGYFNYQNVAVKDVSSVQDLIDELRAGNLIITPMNGQTLDNPYFTPPGPERHMLVIIGFDPDRGQFITNDPGTRQGEGHRYPSQLFFSAIRDYPSGYHVPIMEVNKRMIVVSPS